LLALLLAAVHTSAPYGMHGSLTLHDARLQMPGCQKGMHGSLTLHDARLQMPGCLALDLQVFPAYKTFLHALPVQTTPKGGCDPSCVWEWGSSKASLWFEVALWGLDVCDCWHT